MPTSIRSFWQPIAFHFQELITVHLHADPVISFISHIQSDTCVTVEGLKIQGLGGLMGNRFTPPSLLKPLLNLRKVNLEMIADSYGPKSLEFR